MSVDRKPVLKQQKSVGHVFETKRRERFVISKQHSLGRMLSRSRLMFEKHNPEQLESLSPTSQYNKSVPASPSVKKAFRMVLLGTARTGKTAIVERFLKGTFDDRYFPTVENFHRKLFKSRGDFYQLDIFDLSGYDPFPAARHLHYVSGDLFIICCSVDTAASLDAAFDLWQQVTSAREPTKAPYPVVVAVNKVDIPAARREFTIAEARERAKAVPGMHVIECSAMLNMGISQLYDELFQVAKLPRGVTIQLSRQASQSSTSPSEDIQGTGTHRSRMDVSRQSSSGSTNQNADPSNPGGGGGTRHRSFGKTTSLRVLAERINDKLNSNDGDQQLMNKLEAEARRPSLSTELSLLQAKRPNLALAHTDTIENCQEGSLSGANRGGKPTVRAKSAGSLRHWKHRAENQKCCIM